MMTTSRRKTTEDERRRAFAKIVDVYEARLLRYAYRILHGSDAAQDLVQDAFIRLYRNREIPLENSADTSNWLYRVVHNLAVDHIRRESRRRALHEDHAKQSPSSMPPDRGRGFRLPEGAQKAAEALKTLDLREQQLVILKVYEEKSYKEIGEITGLSTGHVGYILHHAMKKLAAAMHRSRE